MQKQPQDYPDPELAEMDEVAEGINRMSAPRARRTARVVLIAGALIVLTIAILLGFGLLH